MKIIKHYKKQQGFSLIELSLGLCMIMLILVFSVIVANRQVKSQDSQQKNEQSVLEKQNMSQEPVKAVEKVMIVLDQNSSKSQH